MKEYGFPLNHGKMRTDTTDYVDKLNIKTPNIETPIQNLSGGNQQKVLVGRWLLTNPDILIVDEPTRGIDVGAKYEIYKLINDLVEQGRAVLMISSEMEELIGMSDRIIVLAERQMTGELQKEEFNPDTIMTMASAIVDQAAQKEVS
jgi:ABC-type sugar transport system ATPase subunit